MKINDSFLALIESNEYDEHGNPLFPIPTERVDIVRMLCQFSELEKKIGTLVIDYLKVTDSEGYDRPRCEGWAESEWRFHRIVEVGDTMTVCLVRKSYDYYSDRYNEEDQYEEFTVPTELIWTPEQAELIAQAAEQKRIAQERAKQEEIARRKRDAENAVKRQEEIERAEFERLSKKYGQASSK